MYMQAMWKATDRLEDAVMLRSGHAGAWTAPRDELAVQKLQASAAYQKLAPVILGLRTSNHRVGASQHPRRTADHMLMEVKQIGRQKGGDDAEDWKPYAHRHGHWCPEHGSERANT